MTTVPPVPSPRPAEEIRADLARAADGSLDAIANWPALSLRLIDDVASLLADRERLSAELADARATVERVSAAWADVIQRQQRADNEHRYDVEEITGRAVAAERALEAVRAVRDKWMGALIHNRDLNAPMSKAAVLIVVNQIDAALSAASQPESEVVAVLDAEGARALRAFLRDDPEPAASDEPARCPHGNAAAHDVIVSGFPVPPWFRCPGPAASGTPETTE